MADWYRCFSCQRAYPLLNEESKRLAQENTCTSCGKGNGTIISWERVKEDLEAGAYYDIDPKTGGRAKKKR
jgi:DNA-directed RNA polymerase subunit RPC12/RpoP